jgi:hypothetical protein
MPHESLTQLAPTLGLHLHSFPVSTAALDLVFSWPNSHATWPFQVSEDLQRAPGSLYVRRMHCPETSDDSRISALHAGETSGMFYVDHGTHGDADEHNYITHRQATLCKILELRDDITIKRHSLALSGRLLGLGPVGVHICYFSWAQKAQRAATQT